MMAAMPDAVDFFVSYTSADRPWAEWIAWELEQAGHSVIVQAWDIQPGSNFVLEMDHATRTAERTVAVLSPAFLESPYCRAEWAAAFREDPAGEQRKLVPVRVRECDPDGLLGSLVYLDLVDVEPEASRSALLAGVRGERAKPASAPAHPGARAGERRRRPHGGAAIFNVPVKARTFVGRERSLEQLAAGLSTDGAVAVTQVDVIHGLGGVGKTQLAARYARTRRDAYDVIWWLRAEQPATLRADLAALAVALGLVDVDVEEPDAVAGARDWLERHHRWLLVFDNAPGPGAIAELAPEGEGGHVLITSRAHADWGPLGARPIALDVWERWESVAFLRMRTREREPGVLDALADALGDLPLALEQAAAYSNTKMITLTGYMDRLRDGVPELFSADGPAAYGHTVATVWQLPLRQLAENRVASDLICMSAYLAPERIPRELLDAWSDTSDVSRGVVDSAIALLLSYALLTEAEDNTLGMHRLVQHVVRTVAEPAEQRRGAAAAVQLLDNLLPVRSWEPDQWPRCERLAPHVLAATDHATELGAGLEYAAQVLVCIGQYQRGRGKYREAKETTQRGIAIMETIFGPEHRDVGVALTRLSVVTRELGELALAREIAERALTIVELGYGPAHPEVAITLTNLGHVLRELGQLEPARHALVRALTIDEAYYGPEHAELATTLINLGLVLEYLGELAPARDAQQRALAIKEAVYGGEHPHVAIALMNLGNVLWKLGELESAREVLQRALEIDEAAFGLEHPTTARTLANLGIVHAQLGDLEVALETLQRALAIEEATYGQAHPSVAMTLGNVASVLELLGDLEPARGAVQRAITIFERALGPEHQYTAQARKQLITLSTPRT